MLEILKELSCTFAETNHWWSILALLLSRSFLLVISLLGSLRLLLIIFGKELLLSSFIDFVNGHELSSISLENIFESLDTSSRDQVGSNLGQLSHTLRDTSECVLIINLLTNLPFLQLCKLHQFFVLFVRKNTRFIRVNLML
jgi:hypothetical protein